MNGSSPNGLLQVVWNNEKSIHGRDTDSEYSSEHIVPWSPILEEPAAAFMLLLLISPFRQSQSSGALLRIRWTLLLLALSTHDPPLISCSNAVQIMVDIPSESVMVRPGIRLERV